MDMGAGLRHPDEDESTMPSNVFLREDQLLAGDQLILYIRAQITLMKRTFVEPVIAGPAPLDFPDATEAALLMLKHRRSTRSPCFRFSTISAAAGGSALQR